MHQRCSSSVLWFITSVEFNEIRGYRDSWLSKTETPFTLLPIWPVALFILTTFLKSKYTFHHVIKTLRFKDFFEKCNLTCCAASYATIPTPALTHNPITAKFQGHTLNERWITAENTEIWKPGGASPRMDYDKQLSRRWRTGPSNARKGTLAYHDPPPYDEISTTLQYSLDRGCRDWCCSVLVTSRVHVQKE